MNIYRTNKPVQLANSLFAASCMGTKKCVDLQIKQDSYIWAVLNQPKGTILMLDEFSRF